MNLDKIKQLQSEIDKYMEEAIKSSNIGDFFTDKGLLEKTLKMEVKLDLNQIRKEDVIKDEELRDSLREMPGAEFTIFRCCGCPGFCCHNC
ncbi:MAG: hypothetical protein AAGG00_18265 [Cyanobacteria bacterium P01_H01_bin.150]